MQLAEHRTEPNSGLGKAISYLMNHWTRLMLFLGQPGSSIDSNIVERALKKAILNRKKPPLQDAERSASRRSFMSPRSHVRLNGVNTLDYLTELQRHSAELAGHGSEWMPWNYRETVARLATRPAA
jgi:hypothetical protein